MQNTISYKRTIYACYVGFICQAIVVNLAPILFIPLRKLYGLSYEQLGSLVLINFVTQVMCDFSFHRAVDRLGYRPFVLGANIVMGFGFVLFSASPYLFSNPYLGFAIATVIFSGAGGLFEVLLSPIINSIPTDEKASAMSVLHSFYSWGQLLVVLVTTLALYLLGIKYWSAVMLLWLVVPAVSFWLFLKAPLEKPVADEVRTSNRSLIRKPFFIIAFLWMLAGGASEQVAAQWTSAFLDRGLELPKLAGDIAGVCSFAACMAIGRMLYGIYGNRVPLKKVMKSGVLVASACYICIGLSHNNIVSLVACMVCGFAVSLLWPGMLSIAADRYPLAGTGLFAILAAGGDMGCAFGPWLTGVVIETTQRSPWLIQKVGHLANTPEQLGLRVGMLAAAVIPLVAYFCMRKLDRIDA